MARAMAPKCFDSLPLAASQAASVGAHREAASHYQIALRYADVLPPADRARLQEQLSYEYYLTGQYERAIEARRSALDIWRGSAERIREGGTLRWLSRLSWFAGHGEEASQYAVDAVRTLEMLPPGPELAMAYCNRADLDSNLTRSTPRSIGRSAQSNLRTRWANDEILCHALNTLGTDAAHRRRHGRLGRSRAQSAARVGAVAFRSRLRACYMSLSAMAVSRRQYDQASRYLSTGLAYCEERDLDSLGVYMLAYRARLRFEQGDWQEAGEDVRAVLQHPRATSVTRIPALRTLGHLRIRRGDPDAKSPLAEARALGGPTPELQRVGTLAAIGAEAAWLAGDRAGILREVQPAYELVRDRRDPRMKGELAAWLWRVDALDEHPTDIAAPYALEISGDWRACGARVEEPGLSL